MQAPRWDDWDADDEGDGAETEAGQRGPGGTRAVVAEGPVTVSSDMPGRASMGTEGGPSAGEGSVPDAHAAGHGTGQKSDIASADFDWDGAGSDEDENQTIGAHRAMARAREAKDSRVESALTMAAAAAGGMRPPRAGHQLEAQGTGGPPAGAGGTGVAADANWLDEDFDD